MQVLQRHGTRLDAVCDDDFADLQAAIAQRQRTTQRQRGFVPDSATSSLPPRRADRGAPHDTVSIPSSRQQRGGGLRMGALSFDDESPEADPFFAPPPVGGRPAVGEVEHQHRSMGPPQDDY